MDTNDTRFYHDYADLPYILSIKYLIDILTLSEMTVYNMTHGKDFPVLLIGKRRLVRKDHFFSWLKRWEGKYNECDASN